MHRNDSRVQLDKKTLQTAVPCNLTQRLELLRVFVFGNIQVALNIRAKLQSPTQSMPWEDSDTPLTSMGPKCSLQPWN